MEPEIEAKFTQVDPVEIRSKLKEIGAELVSSERLMRRKNYDYADMRLDKVSGWVRLRDEGEKVTLSYKQTFDESLHGTKELCVVVDSFDLTDKFLQSIGLVQKAYQESKRESWVLGGVEIEIDTWPWVPSFVEIEGKDEKAVRNTADLLGFDWSKAKHGGVASVYTEIYNQTSEKINNNWKKIVFSNVPDWLERTRK